MKKYLAFDVGGTSVKYAVVNEEGGVSSSNKFKTPDTLEKMYQEIENVAHEYQDVEGIALSMPGAVDSDVVSSMCVAAVFIIIMLSLSSYIFQKRDI